MASTNADKLARYFKNGASVEISSEDEGFRGSWFAGTVIRPPRLAKNGSLRVYVEYKTIMEDDKGTRRLREELDAIQLRPSPPRENRCSFKFSDDVDAYYNDGWWEGRVIKAVGENKYLVFFRGTREQMIFKASKLRLHREWVYGKWVPPFEALSESTSKIEESPRKPPLSAPVELKNAKIEHHFDEGDMIEVRGNEEGFEGSWYAAKIVQELKDKYLVKYQTLRNDNDTDLLREEVDIHRIRPFPPEVEMLDNFEVHEEVDAFYNDGWWSGVVSKVHKYGNYSVYFSNTGDEMKFDHSKLRLHQEWKHGKWILPSKVRQL